MRKCSLVLISFLLSLTAVVAQTTVKVDPLIERFLGNVSTLDRDKYFLLHVSHGNDNDYLKFYRDYNVARNVGRGYWSQEPFAQAKKLTGSIGVYPAPKNSDDKSVRSVVNAVGTAHPKNVIRYNINTEKAAAWVAEYYKNFAKDNERPLYYEPMNEPFVHSNDSIFRVQQPNAQKMKRRMAEWYAAIGKKLSETPELKKMRVVGYASAWPTMEHWGGRAKIFGHWHNNMKMFMDVAGPHMYGFSVHLYDGLNVTGESGKRSGSNSEAILDMIETYSQYKWGRVKPHAITEYGGIAKDEDYGAAYSDLKTSQHNAATNGLLFNLLEREDNLAISIPFTTGKAAWFLTSKKNPEHHPYGAALFYPTIIDRTKKKFHERFKGWKYTRRVDFYRLWSEVSGKRVFFSTNNPDIQVQAFKNGKKLYVALNNLDRKNQVVNLQVLSGLNGLVKVRIKRLKIYPQKNPQYIDTQNSTAPQQLTLEPTETVVLEYEFNQTLATQNTIQRQKYYSSTHMQEIKANTPLNFGFSGVKTGQGIAVLRMSIGRNKNASKRPVVKLNGTTLQVPDNWKGGDQRSRDLFFGMIEIPVPMELIKANNQVTIQFSDNHGSVSSVVLSVEYYSGDSLPGGGNTPVLADGDYQLGSAKDAQLLAGIGANNGTARMQDVSSSAAQIWTVKHYQDNIYTIQNTLTKEYLEVPQAKCVNGKGSRVGTYKQVLGPHQRWKILKKGNQYELRPAHCEAQALDREAGALNAYTQIYPIANNINQRWKIIPVFKQVVADGTYYLGSITNNQHLMALNTGNHNARMAAPANSPDQHWEIKHQGDDIYTIQNLTSKRYLEVPYAECKANQGTNVATYTYANNTHQQWKIVKKGSQHELRPAHCQTQALDRAFGAIDANVQIYPVVNNNNQRWLIKSINTNSRISENLAGQPETLAKAYPSPTTGQLTVEGATGIGFIYTAVGQRVMKVHITKQKRTIDVSGLVPGTYMIILDQRHFIKFMKK